MNYPVYRIRLKTTLMDSYWAVGVKRSFWGPWTKYGPNHESCQSAAASLLDGMKRGVI